jgi:hypothetical protein
MSPTARDPERPPIGLHADEIDQKYLDGETTLIGGTTRKAHVTIAR